ncbi:DVU_1556 family methyltransferase [Hominifimenecus sp. rT4P-3]|uniref:DVU_1556 family methyltransferase n=1 Tax=Hominifimenecus sp. rT4P-3 TaxID=3242979 RepID=UPI003DA5CD50
MKRDTCLGPVCRPGGFSLTEKMLTFAGFPEGAKLADLGCGQGATLAYLAEHTSFEAVGVEQEESFCDGQRILRADAARLPFEAETLDGVLLECSLSRMEAPEEVLAECFRVLKNRGAVCISDMISNGEEQKLTGVLGRLERRESQEERFLAAGFQIENFWDASRELREFWGQLLFDGRACELPALLGADRAMLKRARCGYGLWILRKDI